MSLIFVLVSDRSLLYVEDKTSDVDNLSDVEGKSKNDEGFSFKHDRMSLFVSVWCLDFSDRLLKITGLFLAISSSLFESFDLLSKTFGSLFIICGSIFLIKYLINQTKKIKVINGHSKQDIMFFCFKFFVQFY